MRSSFVEGSFQFEFDDSWTAVKYDDTTEYARIRNQTEAKGVDFVGLTAAADQRLVIWLIEVKDFRRHRIENAPRIRHGELALEIAQKVRDSVAGVIGANRTSSEGQPWGRFTDALRRGHGEVRVVLWLERDQPRGPATVSRQRHRGMRRKTELSLLAEALKARSKWLTARTFVVDRHVGLEGVTIVSLPNANQA